LKPSPQTPKIDPLKVDVLWLNAIFLFSTPALAVLGLIWWFVRVPFSWAPIAAAFVLFMLSGVVITAGYHRLFSHRTYKASAPVKIFFPLIGAASWQNSAIAWSAHHRRHHRFVDTDKDPYNANRGFWYTHILWNCQRSEYTGDFTNVQDLFDDPILAWQHKYYWPLSIAFNLAIPIAIGLYFGDIASMLLWAGLVRVVVGHHTTFLINSWAHFFGDQPYSSENTARDSAFLALFTHGEGFHNYHHAFEADYRNGRAWYHWDPGKWLIYLLEKVGLASNLCRIPDDMVLRRRFEANRMRMPEMLAQSAVTPDAAEPLETTASRIDEALTTLRLVRGEWQAAVKEKRSSCQIRELKRRMRLTRRTVSTALEEWEQSVQRFASSLSLAS